MKYSFGLRDPLDVRPGCEDRWNLHVKAIVQMVGASQPPAERYPMVDRNETAAEIAIAGRLWPVGQ